MLDLVSQVGTPTLGGGCLFLEGYIGYFGLGPIRDFVGKGDVSEILKELWR